MGKGETDPCRSRATELTRWALRLLAYGSARRAAAWRPRALSLATLDALGLCRDSGKLTLKRIEKRLAAVQATGTSRACVLFENVTMLGAELGLSTLEQDLLAFAILSHTEELLQDCFR